MENRTDLKILKIQKKLDETFIVDNNGMPFQITDDYPLGNITTEVIRGYIANGGEFTEYVEPTLQLSEEEKVLQQINELKTQLTSTDYKVIKAVEVGVTVESEVITERQLLRDEINQLEQKITKQNHL